MRSVKILTVGIALLAVAPGLRAQATGAAQQVRKSAEEAKAQASAQPQKPADKSAAKPAPVTAPKATAPASAGKTSAPASKPQSKPVTPSKPAGQAAPMPKPATGAGAQTTKPTTAPKSATPAAQASAGKTAPAKAQSANKAKPVTKKPTPKPKSASGATRAKSSLEREPTRIARRDPFEAMIGRGDAGGAKSNILLPPGVRGLQVSTLRLDGVVRAPNGMIAVVTNPQSRTYFLREGDQLYDGRVEKISMDAVSFHEVAKDAFGKPVERQVNKRIYASAGELQ